MLSVVYIPYILDDIIRVPDDVANSWSEKKNNELFCDPTYKKLVTEKELLPFIRVVCFYSISFSLTSNFEYYHFTKKAI